jgi:hypothetical protein
MDAPTLLRIVLTTRTPAFLLDTSSISARNWRFWRAVATEVAGSSWTEERRPIPDKPAVAPDTWVLLDTLADQR